MASSSGSRNGGGAKAASKRLALARRASAAGGATHGGEGRVITCEYEGFFLVNVYVPNSKGDLSRLGYRHESWDPDLKDYLIELRHKKPVVLCGDLNVAHQEIDLANPKTNRHNAGFTDEEREGISNLFAEGFLDTFRHLHPEETGAYSWWSYWAGARAHKVGLRIDYFVFSDDLATFLREYTLLPGILKDKTRQS